jgi:hypothetical protein
MMLGKGKMPKIAGLYPGRSQGNMMMPGMGSMKGLGKLPMTGMGLSMPKPVAMGMGMPRMGGF